MMNVLVFNTDENSLKTTIFGTNSGVSRPIAVDANGRFLFSPLSQITITATNLDIRSLNSATDSVTVVADNLNIRNLTSARDNIQIQSNRFVEDTQTTGISSGQNYLLTKDISALRQNSFFVRNTGSGTITVAIQVAPANTDDLYMDHTTPTTVSSSTNYVGSVTPAIKFARIRIQASASGSVVVYYFGRA